MIDRLPDRQRNLSPVNAWPWRGWQAFGGGRGLKEG
jgi:hypothetical protein